MPHLLALPSELLFRIFDDEEITEQLYFLSLLSRRLHHICLPIFLRHNGLPSPADRAEICIRKKDIVIDALSALRIALFVTSIKDLDFAYSTHLNCDAALTSFSRQISRLHSLLQRLESVQNVSISVGALCDLCIKESHKFEKVAVALKNLFDLAVQKCIGSFTISGRGWRDIVNFVNTWEDASRIRRLFRTIKDAPRTAARVARSRNYPLGMQGRGWKFVADTYGERRKPFLDLCSLNLVPTGITATRLDTLVISSPIMLTPPFSTWLIHLFKNSKIQRLEFDRILSYLELDAWSAVLPCISKSAQNITQLFISQCDIHVVDLLQFLCHLPRLTSLFLDDDFLGEPCATFRDRYPHTPRLRPNPEFLALTNLRAPTQLVRHFLNKPNALTKLETLNVVVHQPNLIDLDKSLAVIQHHLSRSKVFPLIGIDVHYGDQNEIRDDVDEFVKNPSASSAFNSVSSIDLELRWANHPDNPFAPPAKVPVAEAICDWLRLFPHASDISLQLRMFHEDAQVLMDGLKCSCPKMKKVKLVVNGGASSPL